MTIEPQLPPISASHQPAAGTVTALAIALAALLAQPNPALSVEIEKGATRLMAPARTNSFYDRLRSEAQIPELKALVEADTALPEKVVFPLTERGKEPPIRIAVHLRGSGTRDQILVLIHGVLASHESWRYLTGALGSEFDLWIIDLPGCGQSDKPAPESLAADGYGPGAIADRVFQALDQCLAARKDSPRVVLVAHSLGGMIALRMTGDRELRRRYGSVLQRMDGLVLLAPGDVSVNQEFQWTIKITKLTGLNVGIGDALGIVREAAAKSAADGFVSPNVATREVADQLYNVLTHAEDRRAAQAMLLQAVPWHLKEHRPDWKGIRQIEANYRNVDKPCLILWGACDEVLPESMGHKLADQIAGAKLVVLPDCMHSIALECPAACVRLIRQFVGGTPVAHADDALPDTPETDLLANTAVEFDFDSE